MRPDRIATLNLDRLALMSGQGKRLEAPVTPGELRLGGYEYRTVPETIEARLDVSRTVAGFALRLRFKAQVEGPCMRCLEPASRTVEVDAREVDQPATGPGLEAEEEGDSEGELTSPYVRAAELEIEHWARDALMLALPDPVLCRPDCAGLCPVCGQRLEGADPEEHRHESGGDPRWAALSELDLKDG